MQAWNYRWSLSNTLSPFKLSDLKPGGGGGERHLFQRECLLEGGHLIKSLQHVNNFVVIIWWKLLKYFTYSWRKTAKIKQTLLDSCGEPKLIIFKIENLSTCLKKKKLQRHLWIIINLLIVGNCSKCCWKVLNTHECRAKYKCNIINLLYF